MKPIVFYGDLGMDAEFEEGKHPRDSDGKFSSAPAGSGKLHIAPHPYLQGKLNKLGFKKTTSLMEGTTSYVHPSGIKVILHPLKGSAKTTTKYTIKSGGKEISSTDVNLAGLFQQLVQEQQTKGTGTNKAQVEKAFENADFTKFYDYPDGSAAKYTTSGGTNFYINYNTGEWIINGGEQEGGGGIAGLKKALVGINSKYQKLEVPGGATTAKPEEKPKQHHASTFLTGAKYEVKGYGTNFGGEGKSILYEKGEAKVEWGPDEQWIAATPGHMTKEGKGLDNLKLLMSGAKPPNPPPWSNSQKVPGMKPASKAAKKTVSDASLELFQKLSKKAPSATSEQIQALKSYCSSGYQHINSILRKNPKSAANNSTVKAIDSYLEHATIPEDITLYRKVGGDVANLLKGVLDVGCVYVEKGFCSSSTSPNTWSGDLHMEINVPKGTKGAGMNRFSGHKSEREVLLQRHTFMRIDSIDIEAGTVKCSVIAQGDISKQAGMKQAA